MDLEHLLRDVLVVALLKHRGFPRLAWRFEYHHGARCSIWPWRSLLFSRILFAPSTRVRSLPDTSWIRCEGING